MNGNEKIPVYNRVEKHGAFPIVSHDENARYNFLASLSNHIESVVAPANRAAFERRVKPVFEQQQGRSFHTRDEVKAAMTHDPLYQTWSALRRSALEMRQQAGRSMVLRQIDELAKKAKHHNVLKPETLTLDQAIKIPRYLTEVDNRCMPGSYYTEYIQNDVANAAHYDADRFVAAAGTHGPLSDGGGRSIVAWLKKNYPDFQPKRILDIGCGVGHNTLPLATGFPDAEVVGIDVSAPMLRYGHARAVSLGVDNVWFRQADAQTIPFDDKSFDWVNTTMFLHELPDSVLQKSMLEIFRVLKPGGLTLHVEQAPYTPEMPLFEQFTHDWDTYNGNEPFWRTTHETGVKEWLKQAGFTEASLLQFGAPFIDEEADTDGLSAGQRGNHTDDDVWNVCGAWKNAVLKTND